MQTPLEYLSEPPFTGAPGIVWATYDLRQAETVQAALQAQRVVCEISQKGAGDKCLYVLRVARQHEAEAAQDFIWRDPAGLRLRPDWSYPEGAENESFKKWIEET
jgi:hypothetical protein